MSNKFPNQVVKLTWKEFCLIMGLRNKYRYGTVQIMMRDGKVIRVLKAFESDELEEPILDKE